VLDVGEGDGDLDGAVELVSVAGVAEVVLRNKEESTDISLSSIDDLGGVLAEQRLGDLV